MGWYLLVDLICISLIISDVWASFSLVEFSSVAQSYLTLCNPMNCSMPGLPVHHQLLESTQTHAHRVGDAIQPSHPVVLFSSCPQSLPASESFPMSQLFARGGQSTGVSALVTVLPKNTQDWSPLEWTGWISLQSKGLSRVFSNTRHHSSKASILQRYLSANTHSPHPRSDTVFLGRRPWSGCQSCTSAFFTSSSRVGISGRKPQGRGEQPGLRSTFQESPHSRRVLVRGSPTLWELGHGFKGAYAPTLLSAVD